MRSSLAEIQQRREELAGVLRREGYLSVIALAQRFSVSEATVRRDLTALERDNRITRTYGGALSEFDTAFVPFAERSRQHPEAKHRVSSVAWRELEPDMTVFLDAGSTVFALSQLIAESGPRPITVVTNSLPVAQILAAREFEDIYLLGGRLLPHQLVVVGGGTGLSLSAWRFDLAVLSAEGMTEDGLWNSRDEISEFQRHVCGRSGRAVFCLDASKLGHAAPSFLLPWKAVERLVTDADPDLLLRWGLKPHQLIGAAVGGTEGD